MLRKIQGTTIKHKGTSRILGMARGNVRIQKKMTPQTTTLLLSTTKPTHHKGDFSTLEPVNPNRQRITVFDGQGAFKDPSDKTNKISSYPADSIF